MAALREEGERGQGIVVGSTSHQGAGVSDQQDAIIDRRSLRMGQLLRLPDLDGDLPIDVTDGRDIDRA